MNFLQHTKNPVLKVQQLLIGGRLWFTLARNICVVELDVQVQWLLCHIKRITFHVNPPFKESCSKQARLCLIHRFCTVNKWIKCICNEMTQRSCIYPEQPSHVLWDLYGLELSYLHISGTLRYWNTTYSYISCIHCGNQSPSSLCWMIWFKHILLPILRQRIRHKLIQLIYAFSQWTIKSVYLPHVWKWRKSELNESITNVNVGNYFEAVFVYSVAILWRPLFCPHPFLACKTMFWTTFQFVPMQSIAVPTISDSESTPAKFHGHSW